MLLCLANVIWQVWDAVRRTEGHLSVTSYRLPDDVLDSKRVIWLHRTQDGGVGLKPNPENYF